MSLTILYHNPKRPREAGMIMIMGQNNAQAAIEGLERRGFVIDKITFTRSMRAAQAD
jgi:hypothetical protein